MTPPQNSTTFAGNTHGYEAGDIVVVAESDRRWWRRLIFWALRRRLPPRQTYWRVVEAREAELTVERHC